MCATRAAVAAMAKRVGKIDILLNAAGFVHHGTVLECSDEDWDFSFDLNVKSMHRTIRAFLPGMLDSGGGSIVNISSAAGVFKAAPNRYVYGATKAAVAALTRAVAADFITKGIRCNCICPGTIETPSMLDRAAAAGPDGREMFVAGSRWDGSAPPRKSPCLRSISPATKARSPPASRTSSTAAGRSDSEETHMNKIDLNGRCAVVTGGAQGFGRAITERFVASGAKVAIWDHDLPFAEKTAKEIGPAVTRLQGRRLRSRRGREDAGRDAEGVRQDRHPRQQCRHRRHQQDGVGNRSRRMAQGAAHQSRRALHLLQGGGAGDDRSRNTAASSTSPRSPARKAIPTRRITRPRRPA